MILDKVDLHHVRAILGKVNAWAPKMRKMSDAELRNQTNLLRDQLKGGKTVDDVLPQAFATIREADYRILGMFPYDVQVMGAIILNQGYIAEMKTGRGRP